MEVSSVVANYEQESEPEFYVTEMENDLMMELEGSVSNEEPSAGSLNEVEDIPVESENVIKKSKPSLSKKSTVKTDDGASDEELICDPAQLLSAFPCDYKYEKATNIAKFICRTFFEAD